MPQRELFPPNSVFSRRVLPALLCLNLLLLLVFLTFNYQLIFHSDSAAKNLLAQEIWDTGQYFPRDWNYVNNDLWVFYTQTFIVPLLGWFRNGFALHAFSDLVSAALILLGSWLITGMLEQSRTARLVSMILLTSGMSLIFAEHVYGQAAYGSMFYMGCFLVYSYWRLAHARGRAVWLWGAATFVMAVLVFWANPQRALMYYGLPLLAASFALHGMDWLRARRPAPASPQPSASTPAPAARPWRWTVLVVLGLVAGTALHAYVMRHVNNTQALTINWLPYESIVANILAFVRGFLNMFEGLPRPEVKVVSLWGAYSVLRLLASLAALALLPWCLFKALRPQPRGRMFFAVFTLAALAGNLLLILTTSLANMGSPEASVRYLVPTMLGMLLLMPSIIIDRRFVKPGTRAAGLFAIAVLGTSAPMTYIKPFDEKYHASLGDTLREDEHYRLGQFLADNKLHYGYSQFWTSGKITVLTEQRVKVRQVNFENGMPVPMRMLSSNRWYRPEAWTGPTFLAVQDTSQIDLPKLYKLMGEPTQVLRFEKSWFIYVFPNNLALLPTWDVDVLRPRAYPIDATSPHIIGKLVEQAGRPPALVGEPAEAGALLYGEQLGVSRGAYLASFDIEALGAQPDFGAVDVCIYGCNKVLARQTISQAGRQRITLRFDAKQELKQLELRVIKSQGGQLKVNAVELRRDPGVDGGKQVSAR